MNHSLKPFDLQAAMRGEPIISRAGEPVQFIAYVPGVDPGQQLVTQHRTGISLTGIDGKAFGRAPQSQDLFMAPCASHCEAQAFYITLRNLHAEIERLRTCNKDAQREIAALLAAAPAQAGEYPPLVCDYCGALTPDPWHSSGILHGKMSKHIHSCDSCAVEAGGTGAPVNAGWCNGCNPDNCGGCVTKR